MRGGNALPLPVQVAVLSGIPSVKAHLSVWCMGHAVPYASHSACGDRLSRGAWCARAVRSTRGRSSLVLQMSVSLIRHHVLDGRLCPLSHKAEPAAIVGQCMYLPLTGKMPDDSGTVVVIEAHSTVFTLLCACLAAKRRKSLGCSSPVVPPQPQEYDDGQVC